MRRRRQVRQRRRRRLSNLQRRRRKQDRHHARHPPAETSTSGSVIPTASSQANAPASPSPPASSSWRASKPVLAISVVEAAICKTRPPAGDRQLRLEFDMPPKDAVTAARFRHEPSPRLLPPDAATSSVNSQVLNAEFSKATFADLAAHDHKISVPAKNSALLFVRDHDPVHGRARLRAAGRSAGEAACGGVLIVAGYWLG